MTGRFWWAPDTDNMIKSAICYWLPAGITFAKIVCGCACQALKIWLSLYQFFTQLPTLRPFDGHVWRQAIVVLYLVWSFNTICCHMFNCVINLRGVCNPNQKLACFGLYLKIVNTFLKSNMHLIVNCPRNSKIALKI